MSFHSLPESESVSLTFTFNGSLWNTNNVIFRSTGHVTRGANEKAEEEFWKAITANVQRSADSIDILLESYLTSHKDSILSMLDNADAD